MGISKKLIASQVSMVGDERLAACVRLAHDAVAHEESVLNDERAIFDESEPVVIGGVYYFDDHMGI